MGTKVSDNGGDFEPIPVGMHRALCINYFDVGYQPGYQGAAPAHKIVVLWEIEPKNIQGKRFTITKIYTASIAEKSNLGQDLVSWRGRPFTDQEREGFDLDNIKGKACQLNVIPNGQGEKVKVGSVLPAMRQVNQTTGKSELTMHWQPETPADFIPNFVKKMIAEQVPAPRSYAETTQPAGDEFTDDIPF